MGSGVLAVCAVGALCILGACSTHAEERAPPEATLAGGRGRLRGFWGESRKGVPIASFEGIPYAKPPLGELRFQAPAPADSWEGVRSATRPGPMCMQRNLYFAQTDIVGDEDCLYINVYAPEGIDASKRLDVMFFIHGGGWISGAGSLYAPEFILDENVVFVTFNYRLGPLGFLSTGDEVIPGNAGLKDMVQALRWVKDNIAAFGGNPDSVTIFGESAGGASVHHLMLSPLAKGLFHKAISQSGTVLSPWAIAPPAEPRRQANVLAKVVGCPAAPSAELRKCLLTKSATDIIGVDYALMEWGVSPAVPFKPVVERGEGASHERHPFDTLRESGPVNDVPYMTGFTSHEGCIFTVGVFLNDSALADFAARFDEVVPLIMMLRHYPKPLVKEAMQKIRHHYFGDGPIEKDDTFNAIDMFSDALFTYPAFETTKLHVKNGKSPVYVYELAHTTHVSFSQLIGSKDADYGVCHADDLLYLFPLTELVPDYKRSVDDEFVSSAMVSYWTSFAKQGRPTADSSWQRVANPSEAEYLHIGSPGDIKMRANYGPERMKLWSNLPISIGRMPATHDEL